MNNCTKGKLIVIEGTGDCTGKETQSIALKNRLIAEGYKVRRISFPDYDSPTGKLIKLYLEGYYGKNSDSLNPYPFSSLYANDRYMSFIKDWGEFYNSGGIIIADRYTTSNIIHQGEKIKDDSQLDEYIRWLYDLEYEKYGLPKPDMVIFLNVSFELSQKLIAKRKNKFNDSDAKDIHENNSEYLKQCRIHSIKMMENLGWKNIVCDKDDFHEEMRSIEDINNEIYTKVKTIL